MAPPDPRNHPYRAGLAAAYLKGKVAAERYVEPRRYWVCAPTADLLSAPTANSLASQLIIGEAFDVYDTQGAMAWGQSCADGYVGYVALQDLTQSEPKNVVTTTALAAHLYPEPNIKSVPRERLPRGARIAADPAGHEFVKTAHGFLPRAHLAPMAGDPVSHAEALLGVPYLWGGRSSFGLDCSALVQVALTAAGQTCPRDSDMQAALGTEATAPLARGDLIFWKGHVGIMQSSSQLLHANAHHMAVVSEPLAQAEARIAATETGPITARRRVLAKD